ncbi:uncharacterized protein LOC114880996 isoform X1 [Osmia bicornis bicornis]|uniref:uncharacterized protein LOC114880996 isoform X1 n=2 Tax=Osmia bicornis bicornis TaxID=1437191 RepID=UPI0010F8AA5D|nr:uncharacterized protein LOC114880996 isoform X1 [Osmia bicornis bicornis]XP_046142782.1 uncharacterized protein LOC114880996 isoform X1 [Osmia bicornis bicornis]
MDSTGRRKSLRESFMGALTRKSLVVKRVDRLKGIQLFRSAIRRILIYMKWLTEEPVVEEISDDVAINIKRAQAKKVEKKALTLEDRSILLTNPHDRTLVERTYIFELFKKFGVFKKYPERLQEILAGVCFYQYLSPGRIIVRQDRPAENLYFIVSGEVSLSKVVTDRWTDEMREIDMGILNPGDIFGEIALLHKLPRSATVISNTTVDLIFISSQDFEDILRPTLMKEWNALQEALIYFNYFKCWDEKMMRECCILSRLKEFQADEVLLGDGKGMVNYVHFLLEGECELIEHIIVREEHSTRGTHYELYDSIKCTTRDEVRRSVKDLEVGVQKMDQLSDIGVTDSGQLIDYTQLLLSSKPLDKRVDFDRSSIVTTTLLDVINEWHKITDVAEMLLREPSSISQQCYPSNVRTIFMRISTYTRGACFGLGENMIDRRIVSKTNVRCFLVPRYWINEHNRANIWERVKLFMDSKFPTKEKLFKEFVNNRRWRNYKQNFVNDIRKTGQLIHSNVTIHDVPYSIRIANDVSG